MMRRSITENMNLYTRSFPLQVNEAQLQYQIWLYPTFEFCGFRIHRSMSGTVRFVTV